MTDPASAGYSLGPPVIAVEALEALRELLSAIRGAGEIGLTVLDNQPVREEGYETIRTSIGPARESASEEGVGTEPYCMPTRSGSKDCGGA